ncbi:MAG: uridine kinase [Myxococcales bacterium]|nr:uridine kinase [Myxococcales bacterium]
MDSSKADWSPVVIGIAGGTGSGKTTVARKVAEKMPDGTAILIQHDWYYHDLAHLEPEERAKFNFDQPKALDNDLLVSHLRALRSGEPVQAPQYDFSTHTRKAETLTLKPAEIIVVEGILLFAIPQLRDMFALRLFVDTDDDIRLMRRIKRDIIHRGRDIVSIQRQYYDTVRPMHLAHVGPTKRFAHLVIPEGGENKIAVDVIVGRLLFTLAKMQELQPDQPPKKLA